MGFADLFSRPTFARGVHPEAHKETASRAIRRMPFAERLTLPLAQHIGKPAIATVCVGEEVVRGQPIARADGPMSVPLHAPADGVIESIGLQPSARGPWTESIVLRVYQGSPQHVGWADPIDPAPLDHAALIRAIQATGIVGLGGAAFPSHIKLDVPAEHAIHTLIVNGCECEPYLTCDHRLMLEHPQDLIEGIRIAMRSVGATRAMIGIEDNKRDAVEALRPHLPADGSISAHLVETKYPQGAEKMLIKSLLGIEVPAGGLPMQLGIVVNNVGTLVSLGQLLHKGEGLTERVVTVTGPGIRKPGDYWVPIGTPIRTVLQWAGMDNEQRIEVILGGPMMGQAIASLDVPVTKGISGILVLDSQQLQAESAQRWPCIHCGACVSACPMGLNPTQLGMLAAKREYDQMAEKFHLGDCFECGCCTYACPSHIPLVQQFRGAKAFLRERGNA